MQWFLLNVVLVVIIPRWLVLILQGPLSAYLLGFNIALT